MIKPSIIALIISGLLIFSALLLTYNEVYNKDTNINGIQLINLILFFSSSIALHGLLHIQAETKYNYNSLEGKIIV